HSPTLSLMATRAGLILGTAGYMSPEQARSRPVDLRSDVFSFGCVLYEMLTGRQPFRGETVTDVIASVVARDPDWQAIPANLNPKLEDVLRRCLAKNPQDRWHAIGDVHLELQAILEDPLGTTRHPLIQGRPRPLWKRALPAVASAMVAATLAAAATVVYL